MPSLLFSTWLPPLASLALCSCLPEENFSVQEGLKEGILLEYAEKRVLHCTHGAVLCFTATVAQLSASQEGVLDDGQFLCPRGLKEGMLLEFAEKTVLHCTHGAVLCFTATIAQFSASQGVLDSGGSIYMRRKINASDGSPETMTGITEGQEHTPTDCSSREAHNKLKEIVGCSSVSHTPTDCSRKLWVAHLEDNGFSHISTNFHESVVLTNHLRPSSVSSQHFCHSNSSKLASLPASHIPRAFVLHISCDEMQLQNGFCIEDLEAPSTPDLQPEVRPRECEALCSAGAERMPPVDNVCLAGADDSVLRENTCKKDANDIVISKEEDIMSTCIVQCSAGEDSSTVSKLSYKCSSSFLCDDSESTSGKNLFKELDFHACTQKQLSACLTITGSPAALSNKLPEYEQAHLMVHKGGCFRTAGRNGYVVQEEMLAMLWVSPQRYLPPRSANNFWLRYLYLEKEIVGSFKLIEFSSKSTSKVSIVSAYNSPNWLKTGSERLPMRSESAREVLHNFEEFVGESYQPSIQVQETGPSKIMEVMGDRSRILNEQVGQSLGTCYSHVQGPRMLNIKCSNGDIIDRGGRHFVAHVEDDTDEASSSPISVADHGPCSPTLSQCSLSSDLSMEGWKSFLLHGEVHERRSRAKLEQFAEIFLLRRHIKQQQQMAQQAPPYLCRESAGLVADADRPLTNIAIRKPSLLTCSFTNRSMKSFETMKDEPTMILAPPLNKPCDVSPRFCDDGFRVGADVVIDVVGLVEYIRKHSSKLETFTDAAVNSIRCTHMPLTGGQRVIPNVSAVIVTIMAIMVYTKILFEGALSWVRAQAHDSEDKR